MYLIPLLLFTTSWLVASQGTDVTPHGDNAGIDPDVLKEALHHISLIDTDSKLRGYNSLKQLAHDGNVIAKKYLAEGYIFGRGLERNFSKAHEIFEGLSKEGNPGGQQGIALMNSLGIGLKANQAKAVINYVFSALGGDHFAQLTMGYRYMMGIGVVQRCETALMYYLKAAEKVKTESSEYTGGHIVTKMRLISEKDKPSVYSVSEDEMINYHHVFVDSGNSGAQMMLGMLYMYGSGGVEKSYEMAVRFFLQAGKEGVPAAYVMIGKIYLDGYEKENFKEDYSVARQYFQKAVDMNHGDGFSGLGVMLLHGLGVEQSYSMAYSKFSKAADLGSTEGQYYVGLMNYNGLGRNRDTGKAFRYFQLAGQGGHLRALYQLGIMHAQGINVKRNCNYAVELLKSVSERGGWTRMFTEAEKLHSIGDTDSALLLYLIAAELGVEVAQSNVAYLLEQGEQTLINRSEALKRAFIYWNRAAAQGLNEARVKLGDYYYYGHGVPVNYEVAAHQYRMVSDKQTNAQAMFNLGYMYQEGLGLEKDFHLAKRYYDMASDTSAEAIIPVKLALLKLSFLQYEGLYKQVVDTGSLIAEGLETVGPNWDIYLITILVGFLIIIFFWRRNR